MTGKYTPGPWAAEIQENGDWFIVADGNEVISVMQQWSPAVDKADAHLIAAAPDLLEALKAIQADPTIKAVMKSPLWFTMVEAIAKAEGRA